MNDRNYYLFCVGFNLALLVLCSWGYAVSKHPAFAATAFVGLICGATATHEARKAKNNKSAD